MDEPIGCLCYMPVAAAMEKNCWAYDHGLHIGWPDELNSFPHTKEQK